jgi:methylmalonyl-CoA/ethylmalonyl-CoA epimerase
MTRQTFEAELAPWEGNGVAVDSIRIQGLQQVAQRAKDLDASIAFYRDVLELRFIAKFDPPGIAFFDMGGTRLFLEKGETSALLYFRVPNIHAAYASLQSKGVKFEHEPSVIFKDDAGQFGTKGEEEWMAFFRDPSDNMLAIASRQPAPGQ